MAASRGLVQNPQPPSQFSGLQLQFTCKLGQASLFRDEPLALLLNRVELFAPACPLFDREGLKWFSREPATALGTNDRVSHGRTK